MMKLFLLRSFIKELTKDVNADRWPREITDRAGYTYNLTKMIDDQDQLADEFLSTYVVQNPPKGVKHTAEWIEY